MKEILLAIFIGCFLAGILVWNKKKKNAKPEVSDKIESGNRRNLQYKDEKEDREAILREKLLLQERKLWEIKSAASYEKFFDRSVMSIQILLGLANVSVDEMDGEKKDYYIWDNVLEPLKDAMKACGAKIGEGGLVLSEQKADFKEKEIRENIGRLSRQELERYIQENEQQICAGKIVFCKAGVVSELGYVIKELEEFRSSGTKIRETDLKKLAQKVRSVLERNGLYPMFAKDERLSPELRRRFSPVNEYSVRYPGLFVKTDDKWEVLGANIGMDDCGV